MIKIENSRIILSQQEYNLALQMFKNGQTVRQVQTKLFPNQSYSSCAFIRKHMIAKNEIEKKAWAVKAHENRKKNNLLRASVKKVTTVSKVEENQVNKKDVAKKPQSLSKLVEKTSPKTIVIDFKGVTVELQKTPKILITENKIVVV